MKGFGKWVSDEGRQRVFCGFRGRWVGWLAAFRVILGLSNFLGDGVLYAKLQVFWMVRRRKTFWTYLRDFSCRIPIVMVMPSGS